MPFLHSIAALLVGFVATSTVFLGGGPGTINQLSPFSVTSTAVKVSSTTANFQVPSLANKSCIGTDSNGVFQAGTCSGGGGNSFAYPFPSNATSTLLNFNGGLTAASLSIGSLSGVLAANSGAVYATATGTVSGGSVISATAGQSVLGSGLTITTAPGTFGGSGTYTFPTDVVLGSNLTLGRGGSVKVDAGNGVGSPRDAFVAASSNIFVGPDLNQAAANTGTNNTFLGYDIGTASLAKNRNTFIGAKTDSGLVGSGADDQTALGYQALKASRGNGNIGIGSSAAAGVTSGTFNIGIGAGVNFASNTGSGQLNIGNLLFGTGLYQSTTSSATAVTGGTIGVGTTTPGATLGVQGNGLFSGNLNAANITATGTLTVPYASTTAVSGTSLCISSDCRTSWPTGGSGGSGNVATSTSEVATQLAIFTSTGATPATIGGDSRVTYSNGTLFLNSTDASENLVLGRYNGNTRARLGYDASKIGTLVLSDASDIETLTLTATGASTIPYASTTGFSTGYASSTNYYGAGLATCSGGNFLTWSGGKFGCAADTTGSTFSYLFPSNATTTQIAFDGGLTAAGATTTALAVTGSSTVSSVLNVGGVLNANGGIVGSLTGNASTATKLQTARNINGVAFDGTADITVNAASSTLLANNNTFSGNNTFSNTITGSITGNAGTVTNGVYTTTFNGLFDARFVTDLAATTSVSSITTLPNLSLPYSQLTGAPTQFSYPFPSNATTTLLRFSGGASTTAFSANTLAVGQTGTTSIASTGALSAPSATVGTLAGFIGGNSGALYAFATSTIKTSQLTNDAGFLTSAVTSVGATYPIISSGGTTPTISTAFGTTSNTGIAAGNLYIGTGGLLQTAASSSIFGYTPLNPTRQITINGTANQITSSAGAQDLSADRTWTLSLPADFRPASTTLTGNTLLAGATSTSLGVTNLLNCDTIDTDSTGSLRCGTDATGGGASFAYPFPSNATTTVLTLSNGASIAKLTNLTSNGFVKTSGGDGTLSIDTNTYLTSAITSLGPVGQLQTGATGIVQLATSTLAFNGLTFGATIVGSGNVLTWTPTVTGTLSNSGLANSTISGISLGSNLANLSATDSTLTFSGTYNGSTARTIGINLGNANTWTALQTINNASTTNLTAGSFFKLPTATSFSNNMQGTLAYDSTSGNVILGTSTTPSSNHVVIGGATTTLYAFSIASTSPDFASGGSMKLPGHFLKQVVTAIICQVDGGTSQVINLSNEAGSSDTNTITCTTSSTQFAITSNNSFNAYTVPSLEFGTKTGSPDYINIRVLGYRVSD